MNILILLILIMPFTAFSTGIELCDETFIEPVLSEENESMLNDLEDGIKKDFKRRPLKSKNFDLALSIETNFTAPIIGEDKYWGRIYLKKDDSENIAYRDELITEKHYKKESKSPSSFQYSTYSIADINSSDGLSLIKAAGAEVNVKSPDGKFTSQKGGRLSIKVKAPNEKAMMLTMDVSRSGGKIYKSLIIDNKKIPFDSFKINASENFMGVTSVLAGIDNVQFYSNGKIVHTINQ